MKQLMAGGGVVLIGITLIPLLSGLFSTTSGVAFFNPNLLGIANIFNAPSTAAAPNIVMTSYHSMAPMALAA